MSDILKQELIKSINSFARELNYYSEVSESDIYVYIHEEYSEITNRNNFEKKHKFRVEFKKTKLEVIDGGW